MKANSKTNTKSAKPKTVADNPASLIHDDVYEYKDNEFEQIRQCLGMYVGSDAQTAASHLVNEITANSLDELTNPNTIGKTIWITFMEKECKFIIEDDGRGIPHNILADVISKKHYSTKFTREFNKFSGGQNGVGTTITAALSDHYLVTSTRDGLAKTVAMQNDELIDLGTKKAKPGKHGTYTEFIPSQKWLGKFKMELADVEDYLRRLSYVMPDGIKIKFLGINKRGKETARTYTRQGIAANVEYLSQSLEFPPITLSIPEQTIDEPDHDTEYFKLEFSFSYDRTLDDMVTASFCDYLATKEGGTHEQVVQQAICSFFSRQAKALDPNAKYEVNTDDCKKGLVFVVNCDHSNPKFEGQHKSKVDQKNIIQYGRKPIMDALSAFFETNNGLLRKIIQYLRQISKIRMEAKKIKNTTLKKPTTFLDDADIGKIFVNISDRNYSGYKEILLSEGDSAVSAVGSARNSACQAIFAITGVIPNTFGWSTQKVKENPTFAALIKVLGCGIGNEFDLNKLKWNAVITATDSDVDGSNITSLLLVFFACHMPEIITSGRLYKVIPALYRIDDKSSKKYMSGQNYIFDKKEYYDLYHRIIADNVKVKFVYPQTNADAVKGAGEVTGLSKKDLIKALGHTTDYLSELQTLVKRSACNIVVLEYICYFIMLTSALPEDKRSKEFQKMLTKKFPELHYHADYESIMGSYEGENITLIIDKIFFKMARRFLRILAESPTFYLLCENRNASKDDPRSDDWDLMTLGQFLVMCDKSFQVGIEQRYKGLGESDADMIFPSMMNPKTRKLLRITMHDAKEAMATLQLLHGDGDEWREARRKLLKEADITLEDIDN
jgi:DNA gyrase subunit B